MYGAILVSPEQPVQCMYGQPIRQSRNTTVLTVTTSVELRPRATRWAISLDFTKQKFLRHHAVTRVSAAETRQTSQNTSTWHMVTQVHICHKNKNKCHICITSHSSQNQLKGQCLLGKQVPSSSRSLPRYGQYVTLLPCAACSPAIDTEDLQKITMPENQKFSYPDTTFLPYFCFYS